MLAKGWIEKQMDAKAGARYRITPEGEAAMKAKIPTPSDSETRVMNGNIFNSQGALVAVGSSIFSPTGKKLYDLRGAKIYKLSGELVGHLANARSSEQHLDRATDKLFPAS
jgi:hypothetical protein